MKLVCPFPGCRARLAHQSSLSRHKAACQYRFGGAPRAPAAAPADDGDDFDFADAAMHDSSTCAKYDCELCVVIENDDDDEMPPPPVESGYVPAEEPPTASAADRERKIEVYTWIWVLVWAARNRISFVAVGQLLVLLSDLFRWKRCACSDAAAAPSAHPSAPVDTRQFPNTYDKLGKSIGIDMNNYTITAMCPSRSCGATYTVDEARRYRRCTRFVHVINEQPSEIRTRQRDHLQRLVDEHGRIARADPEARFGAHGSQAEEKRFNELTRRCGAVLLKRDNRSWTELERVKHAALALAEDAARSAPGARFSSPYTIEKGLTAVPAMEYRSLGLIDTLLEHMRRPLYASKCETWRRTRYRYRNGRFEYTRPANAPNPDAANAPPRVRADIHDGDAWHRYMYVDTRTGQPWEESAQVAAEAELHRWEGEQADAAAPIPPEEDPFRFKRALLAEDGTLALAMNIDWFQPFKMAGSYSVGAIYMTNLNLPREERYLLQNIILIGILPGPRETSRTQLQGVLELVVSELQLLYEGVKFTAAGPGAREESLRAFLLCIICDEPALRSTCGFLSHSGHINCAYCMNAHKGANAISNTGECDKWIRRTNENHRSAALEWSACGTHPLLTVDHLDELDRHRSEAMEIEGEEEEEEEEEERKASDVPPRRSQREPPAAAEVFVPGHVPAPRPPPAPDVSAADEDANASDKNDHPARRAHAREHGSRYCAVMRLKYWDAVRGAPIDTMHNFLLGICKNVATKLKQENTVTTSKLNADGSVRMNADGSVAVTTELRPATLTATDLKHLQTYVNRSTCPSDIGRIPGKIAGNFSNFKAAEWRNLMSIFMVPAMRHLRATHMKEKKASKITDEIMLMMCGIQEVSVLLQGYTIDADQIDQMHELFVDHIRRVEAIFGASAVTPNLHWSCHLKEMFLDYGPPAGWWCSAYERYNGLLVGVPFAPAHVEVSLIRRFILLIRSSEAVDRKYSSLSNALSSTEPDRAAYQRIQQMVHTSIVAESGAEGAWSEDLHHSIVRTASGRKQHVYTYTNWKWSQVHAAFIELRVLKNDRTHVKGNESFPGQLMRATGDSHELIDIMRWPAEWTTFIKSDHIIDCLRSRYLETYEREITCNYATFAPRVRQQWLDRTIKLEDKMLIVNAEPYNYNILTYIRVFRTLLIGGEVIGSKLSERTHRNANVGVVAHARTKEDELTKVSMWGQVQFFFTHVYPRPLLPNEVNTRPVGFVPKTHYFAAMKYYPHLDYTRINAHFNEKLTGNPAQNKTRVDLQGEVNYIFPLCHSALSSVKCIYDVVPVHSITGRFIPHKSEAHSNIMQVMRIPSKMHA
jgi:hypothetical protein